LALTVVVVSGSVGGAYVLATRGQPAQHAPQATPSKLALPAAPVAARPQAASVESAPSPAPLADDAPPSTSGARASATSLSEHAELLRDARTALASGDAAKALALIDAHPEVGRGALGPEWGAARILVLCRLGRVAESKQLARRFLKSHPSSPLAAQVAASCAGAE
jgi:RNA polymerase sigma-70 factor (ECF subfamily)